VKYKIITGSHVVVVNRWSFSMRLFIVTAIQYK